MITLVAKSLALQSCVIDETYRKVHGFGELDLVSDNELEKKDDGEQNDSNSDVSRNETKIRKRSAEI